MPAAAIHLVRHECGAEHACLQVYQPLEFLFTVAAFTTLIENFLPQLISLPKVPQLQSALPSKRRSL